MVQGGKYIQYKLGWCRAYVARPRANRNTLNAITGSGDAWSNIAVNGGAEQEQRRLGVTMLVLAWVVVLGLVFLYFRETLERQRNPNQSVETRYGQDGAREVVLKRNKYGHYITAGEINGREVTFLLDTGATGVAIPSKIAKGLALRRGRPFRTQTANGISTSYAVTLKEVRVGDIVLRDVSAGIAENYHSDEVLLGMSFLKYIEFTQRGDTLILRQ